MRVTFSATGRTLSALALLLIKESVFLSSEYRQALELAHKCTCPIVDCPELDIVDQKWKFPFLCGLGTGVLVALALASILRYLCSSSVEPATLRVRRARQSRCQS